MKGFLVLFLLVGAQLLWLQVYIPYEVRHDARKIKEDGSRDSLKGRWHTLGALKNGAASFLLSFGFTFWHWSIAVALWLVLMSLYWIAFDRKLNLERGLDPDYIGQSSAIDKWYLKRYRFEAAEAMQRHKYWLLGMSYFGLGTLVVLQIL